MGICRRKTNGQEDALAINDEVVFGPWLTAVRGIGAGLLAPLLARTLLLSRLARLQSMTAASPSQLSSRVCSRSQTPASCQSRRRRQQVTPLPQPSSRGNNRLGQPVRSTKMIPPRAARLGTRGRPPLGLGGSFGSSGSIASQRSSGTRGRFFMGEMMPQPRGSETRSSPSFACRKNDLSCSKPKFSAFILGSPASSHADARNEIA